MIWYHMYCHSPDIFCSFWVFNYRNDIAIISHTICVLTGWDVGFLIAVWINSLEGERGRGRKGRRGRERERGRGRKGEREGEKGREGGGEREGERGRGREGGGERERGRGRKGGGEGTYCPCVTAILRCDYHWLSWIIVTSLTKWSWQRKQERWISSHSTKYTSVVAILIGYKLHLYYMHIHVQVTGHTYMYMHVCMYHYITHRCFTISQTLYNDIIVYLGQQWYQEHC